MYTPPVRIPTGLNAPVPPTPGPRSMEQIHNDAKARFAGILWIQRDPNRKIEDYFNWDDYWEPYSESTIYSKRTYQAAYKGIMRDYNNYLCILESEVEDSTEYYVVAKRARNELEELEPYCPCITCSSSRCNPLKYLWCPVCTHCIRSGKGFANKDYIERAKISKEQEEERKKIPGKYDKYLSPLRTTRGIEVITASIIGLIGLYCWF